jgi:hypothetical protein
MGNMTMTLIYSREAAARPAESISLDSERSPPEHDELEGVRRTIGTICS